MVISMVVMASDGNNDDKFHVVIFMVAVVSCGDYDNKILWWF